MLGDSISPLSNTDHVFIIIFFHGFISLRGNLLLCHSVLLLLLSSVSCVVIILLFLFPLV